MPSNKRIWAAKVGYIIISILIGVLGIVLIATPNFSVSLLCRLGGGILILFGIVKIIGYCSNDLYRLAFQYDLAIGLLSVVLAVLIFIYPNNLMTILPFGIGLYVLSDALFKLQTAFDAKMFGMSQWTGLLTASLIASVAGIVCLIVAVMLQEPTILVGVAITADGALNFFNTMATVRVGAQKKHRFDESNDPEI